METGTNLFCVPALRKDFNHTLQQVVIQPVRFYDDFIVPIT